MPADAHPLGEDTDSLDALEVLTRRSLRESFMRAIIFGCRLWSSLIASRCFVLLVVPRQRSVAAFSVAFPLHESSASMAPWSQRPRGC